MDGIITLVFVLVLAIFGFALIGLVHTARLLFGRGQVPKVDASGDRTWRAGERPEGSAQPLPHTSLAGASISRLAKLEITRQVLREMVDVEIPDALEHEIVALGGEASPQSPIQGSNQTLSGATMHGSIAAGGAIAVAGLTSTAGALAAQREQDSLATAELEEIKNLNDSDTAKIEAHPSVALQANRLSDDDDETVDLGDAGLVEHLPLDTSPLQVDDAIAALPASARLGLGAFMSFENIIFGLASVLILGGTLYLAALSWGRVPSRLQFLFIVVVTLFYGALMTLAARLLEVRLKLDGAARVLLGLAYVVGLIAAAIAAGAYRQSWLSGVLASLIVVAYCVPISTQLALHSGLTKRAARALSLAALSLSLVGLCLLMPALPFLPGSLLLLAMLSGLWALREPSSTKQAEGEQPIGMLLLSLASLPLVAGLTTQLLDLPLAYATPSLAALGLLSAQRRSVDNRNWGLLALGLTMLAMVLAISSVPALVVVAMLGVWSSVKASVLLRDSRGFCLPLERRARLHAFVGAGLWIFVSTAWAPAIGSAMTPEAIAWLIDLVTAPGERVSASWGGLAALPNLLLALWLAERWRSRGDPRANTAELSAAGLWILASGATLATLDRQAIPSAIMLALLALSWTFWGLRRESPWRLAPAQFLWISAAFGLGYHFSESAAWLGASLAGLVLMAVPGRSSRWVASLAAPILLLALAATTEYHQAWLVLFALSFAGLQLVQPGGARLPWLRTLVPLNLFIAWMLLFYYADHGHRGHLDEDYVPVVIAGFIVLCALWVALRKGPHFLRLQASVAAFVLALVGAGMSWDAFDRGMEGYAEPWIGAIGGAMALVSLLLMGRGSQTRLRVLLLLITTVVAPVLTFGLFETRMLWPGAAALLMGALLLLWRSRREQTPWLAGFAFFELWLASQWWTLFTASFFSTGGGEERVLSALGLTTLLIASAIHHFGQRLSGATRSLAQGSGLSLLLMTVLLTSAGATLVDNPKNIDLAFSLIDIVSIGVVAFWFAVKQQRAWLVYLSETAMVCVYASLRLRTDAFDFMHGLDGVAMAGGALLLVGLSKTLSDTRLAIGQAPSAKLAALLPLAVPFAIEWDGTWSDSTSLATVAGFYAWMARRQAAQRYAWIALIAVNAGLIPMFAHYRVDLRSAYLMPLGLSLGFMAQVYARDLGSLRSPLRSLAALIILGAGASDNFAFSSPLAALALAGLSVGAVMVGLAWRQRAYLTLGFGFLLLDIVVNLTRWGMHSRMIAAALGLIGGAALFAFGVAVAKHKDALLKSYRKVQDWEW